MPANSRSSSRVWKSSSLVVRTSRTSVSGTTSRATSSYSASRDTSTVAPESFSRYDSSRTRLIGLIDTMMPPAFQAATIEMTNCGHVLQVDGQAVAGGEAIGQQAGGQPVAELVELPAGDAAVEVLQGDARRVAGHPGAEHVEGVVELERRSRRAGRRTARSHGRSS